MARSAARFAGVALLAVGLWACAPPAALPEGSVEVRIETEAPLPSPAATGAPVFDGVRLEPFAPDGAPACDGCARELSLTRELVDAGATFVVQSDEVVILRVRLFCSRLAHMALEPGTVVERWVRLPPRPPEGTTRLAVMLPMERVGQPLGSLAEPTAPDAAGARLPPLPAATTAAVAATGEVCLDGGWFWMGDPRLPPESAAATPQPRLVHLSPFCVDDHEVTVAELRRSGVDTTMVVRWSGGAAATEATAFCDYTDAPGPNDDRPVNCVQREVAQAACQARGGDLPTAAQLEYLGSAFGRSSFVWGHDLPGCADAVFGRAVGVMVGDTSCSAGATVAFLPLTAVDLAATRDVLAVGAARIVGLASNLAELTREAAPPAGAGGADPPVGVLRDPERPVAADTTLILLRAGSYAGPPAETAAAVRASMGLTRLRPDVGFRCVR